MLEITKQPIIRTWTNFFAATGYQLADGTIIYISYNNDEITIQKPEEA